MALGFRVKDRMHSTTATMRQAEPSNTRPVGSAFSRAACCSQADTGGKRGCVFPTDAPDASASVRFRRGGVLPAWTVLPRKRAEPSSRRDARSSSRSASVTPSSRGGVGGAGVARALVCRTSRVSHRSAFRRMSGGVARVDADAIAATFRCSSTCRRHGECIRRGNFTAPTRSAGAVVWGCQRGGPPPCIVP